MSQKVMNRNRAVLDAALDLAVERGFRRYSRCRVAERAGVSNGSVSHAFGTMDALHDAVMAAAVDRLGGGRTVDMLKVLGQGLFEEHPIAMRAPVEFRRQAIDRFAA